MRSSIQNPIFKEKMAKGNKGGDTGKIRDKG